MMSFWWCSPGTKNQSLSTCGVCIGLKVLSQTLFVHLKVAQRKIVLCLLLNQSASQAEPSGSSAAK